MCSYRATGKDFDVGAYFKKNSISKAEPLTAELGSRLNGISVPINDKLFGRIKPQIAAASKFLDRHHDELLKLSKNSNVRERILIFSYAPGEASATSEKFPSELLLKLGKLKIDIELSIYPGSKGWISRKSKKATAMIDRYRNNRAALIRSWKQRLFDTG